MILKSLLILFLFLMPIKAHAFGGTLVLIVDLSASVDEEELILQREAYARAMEWITPLEYMNLEVITYGKDYRHISSGSRWNAAAAFRSETLVDRSSTCLLYPLQYVELIYDNLPQPVIIDISGDGGENCSANFQIKEVLDRLHGRGAVVNALLLPMSMGDYSVIMNHIELAEKQRQFQEFFRSLTRGMNSFYMIVETVDDFQEAIINKIIREIVNSNMIEAT